MRTRQVFLRTFRQCHRTGNHPTSSCPHNSRHGSPLRNCLREYHRRHGQNLRGPHRPVPATSVNVRLKYPAGVSGVLQAWLVELRKVCNWSAAGSSARPFSSRRRHHVALHNSLCRRLATDHAGWRTRERVAGFCRPTVDRSGGVGDKSVAASLDATSAGAHTNFPLAT